MTKFVIYELCHISGGGFDAERPWTIFAWVNRRPRAKAKEPDMSKKVRIFSAILIIMAILVQKSPKWPWIISLIGGILTIDCMGILTLIGLYFIPREKKDRIIGESIPLSNAI